MSEQIFWVASANRPVYLYYCKSKLKTGDTVVVMQDNKKTFCKGVHYSSCSGDMKHQNSVGVAKASGARVVLRVLNGRVYKCED